jgi:hypothetical protein
MSTNFNDERLTTLAGRLADATTSRAAQWRIGDGDVYSWMATEGSVTIASRDRDGEPPYELTVHNADGEQVDELTSELLADDQPAPWNVALAELYRAARRSALRADDIIDALIDALPSPGGAAETDRAHLFLGRGRKSTSVSEGDST